MFNVSSDSIALIDSSNDRKVTYRELSRSYFPNERSLIFLFNRNSVQDILYYVSAINAGHVICLLDGEMNESFKKQLITTYSPDYVVDKEIYPFNLKKIRHVLHPELSLLLATSGTTGNPKFIRLSKDNVISNARSIIEYLTIDSKERPIASLPFHYSYGLSVLNSHLMAGATVVLTKSSVAQKDFWEVVKKYECTSLAGVPYTYKVMERIGFLDMDLPFLRTLTQAGGRLEPSLIRKFHQKKPRLFVMYGQTEATARMAFLPPEYLPEKAGAIGIPIPGGSLNLNELGELIYQGPNVMMGYANNASDLSKGDELNGILNTGDLGYVDKDHLYYVTGRSKRISKIYGLRINLDDIEKELSTYGTVAVTTTDLQIIVYIENGTLELSNLCMEHLIKLYKLHPSTFKCVSIEQLPRMSSGKIDYRSLA